MWGNLPWEREVWNVSRFLENSQLLSPSEGFLLKLLALSAEVSWVILPISPFLFLLLNTVVSLGAFWGVPHYSFPVNFFFFILSYSRIFYPLNYLFCCLCFFILNISDGFTFPAVLVHFCFSSRMMYYSWTDLSTPFMSLGILHTIISESFSGVLWYLHFNCADIHAALVVWLFLCDFPHAFLNFVGSSWVAHPALPAMTSPWPRSFLELLQHLPEGSRFHSWPSKSTLQTAATTIWLYRFPAQNAPRLPLFLE